MRYKRVNIGEAQVAEEQRNVEKKENGFVDEKLMHLRRQSETALDAYGIRKKAVSSQCWNEEIKELIPKEREPCGCLIHNSSDDINNENGRAIYFVEWAVKRWKRRMLRREYHKAKCFRIK